MSWARARAGARARDFIKSLKCLGLGHGLGIS